MRTIIDPDYSSTQELSPYQVHSRREIIGLLRSVEHHKQLVSMHINKGAEAIVTSVLAVDETNDTVIIDSAPSEELNKRIVANDNISFETVLDHIRILFFATRAEQCVYDNLPALRIPLPANLIRLQRREFYRVPVPLSMGVRCDIQIPDDMGTEMETISLTLQNVSGGGIALIDDKKRLDNTPGFIYKNCRITLPGNTVVVTSLQVKNSQDLTLPNGKTSRRIGCLFYELSKPMLTAIQRFITKVEREQNAKATGIR
ncbi:MAG TPA: flagellar brake protein [Burkholderiaceae bacterium]|jgi:c-di-GMP-binding flagellar brake protein YcgR